MILIIDTMHLPIYHTVVYTMQCDHLHTADKTCNMLGAKD